MNNYKSESDNKSMVVMTCAYKHLATNPNIPLILFQISSLQFLSDPCTIDVNGYTLGMTSTDVLFHMGGEEIAQ